MNQKKSYLFHKFSKIFFISMAALCLYGAGSFFANKIYTEQFVQYKTETLFTAEDSIIARLENASVMVSLLAATIRDKKEKEPGMSRREMTLYLRHLLNVLSASALETMLEPLRIYGYINGELLTSAERPPGAKFEAERQSLFAGAAAKTGQTVASPPHFDPRTHHVIFSVAKAPVFGNGIVLALDFDLEALCAYVKSIYSRQGGYGILLAPDATILTYNDDIYLGAKFNELSAEHQAIMDEVAGSDKPFSFKDNHNTSGANVTSFMKKMSNGWYIGFSVPQTIYSTQVQNIKVLLIAFILTLIAISTFFFVRLNREKIRADERNKAKSLFLARMSHEIRTPLNSILGMADIISQMDIPSKALEYISIINMSGNSLLAIINDILDFSKIESCTMKIEHNEYSFTSLLNDIINAIQIPLMGKQHLDFIVHVEPTIPEKLIGDEIRIRQIMFNLLSNAVKYTNKGFIHLSISHHKVSDNMLKLTIKVKDTGIGIPHDKLSTVFDDFTRVDAEKHANIEGTGLGLAITKTLCGMMHGHLSVKSKFQHGSSFTAVVTQGCASAAHVAEIIDTLSTRMLLYVENPLQTVSLLWACKDLNLPRPYTASNDDDFVASITRGGYDYAIVSINAAKRCIPGLKGKTQTRIIVLARLNESVGLKHTESLVTPVYSIPLAHVINGERSEFRENAFIRRYSYPEATILVVDDIPANLLVAKELLARYGAKIETAINGADAVEILKKYAFDIVFMDHMMPEMDGIAATIAIRALGDDLPHCRAVPIIALTANAMSGQREIFLQSGMTDFLAKPVDVEKLDKMLLKHMPVDKRVEFSDEKHAVEDADAQPSFIRGVNTQKGLRNVGGSMTAYCDILMEFCRDAQIKIEDIKNALNSAHLNTYTVLAHSFKGMAGVIGATHIAYLAAELEDAATREDLDFLHGNTDAFLNDLRDTLLQIKNALDALSHTTAQAENRPADLAVFKFDVMREALRKMDMHTANNLLSEYMEMVLNDEQRKILSEIDQLITAFEYDMAIEKIDAWEKGAV
ncbi:MAG: response regulator [Desulfovibrio sp.]|nr:response regulator [Desulfovibrio sp.]